MRTPDINWQSNAKTADSSGVRMFNSRGCMTTKPMLPGTGMSAKELAFRRDGVIKNEGVYHTKTDEDRFRLMVTIMRNDFFDLVKKLETKRTVFLNSRQMMADLRICPIRTVVLQTLKLLQWLGAFIRLLTANKELLDLIDAVVIFGCPAKGKRSLIYWSKCSEITNRQKKLKYRRAPSTANDYHKSVQLSL